MIPRLIGPNIVCNMKRDVSTVLRLGFPVSCEPIATLLGVPRLKEIQHRREIHPFDFLEFEFVISVENESPGHEALQRVKCVMNSITEKKAELVFICRSVS